MDKQQSTEANKENDACAANVSKIKEPITNFNPDEVTPSTSGNLVENDDRKADKTKKKDQPTKVLKNSTLGARFKEYLQLRDKESSSDEDIYVDGANSSETFKNGAKSSLKSSNLKRPHTENDNKSTKSKKSKVINENNGPELNQIVVTTATVHLNEDKISDARSVDHLADVEPISSTNHDSQMETPRSIPKKRKKSSRKGEKKELNYDAILTMLTTIHDDINWLKEHYTGLESFVVDNLTANSENWNQVKHVKETSSTNATLTIEDINRPPEVGYVRLDTNMIHLGNNVWLPKQSYDDAVYNASTNSMFVKNIAIALFGAQYLKEHSVKGKSSNKTKSIPRPAIDPTKALAVRDIFEYYLKNNKQLIGQNLLLERDMYEDHIRAKISDLLRPPKKSNLKVPKEPPKPKESSSSESSSSSENDEDAEKGQR